MAFVNELIPEEDKKQFENEAVWGNKNGKHFRNWPLPTHAVRWNIDRERNMFARDVGGSGREGAFNRWVLSVNGQQIQYYEKHKNYTQVKGEIDLKYYIERIEMPSALNVSLEQVKQWIEEVCYAEACQPGNTKYVPIEKIKVEVIFDQTPSELAYY